MKKVLIGMVLFAGVVGGLFAASFTDVDSHATPILCDQINANFADIEDGTYVGSADLLTFTATASLLKGTETSATASTLGQTSNGSYMVANDLQALSGTTTTMVNYVQEVNTADDSSSGSEDGKKQIKVYVAGTARTVLTLAAATVLGSGNETIAVDSSDWDISTAGAMTGVEMSSALLTAGSACAAINGAGITNINPANLSGTALSQIITNAGTGYTNLWTFTSGRLSAYSATGTMP